MATMAEEKRYEKRISFYRDRIQTCGYRFYEMVQTRTKEVPKLATNYDDEVLQQEIQNKVLGSANTFINCLDGEHYSQDIPDYLQEEANRFKGIFFTRLSPKFHLQEQRLKLLETIFDHREGL